MNDIRAYFKDDKKQEENKFYAPTKSLCDENGEPLKWEFRRLTSREVEDIREKNTVEVQIPGKPGMFRNRVNVAGVNRDMICASIVNPNLLNAELQDSYGVKTPGDLLQEMVDSPGEYDELAAFVTKLNDYDIEKEIEAAKN